MTTDRPGTVTIALEVRRDADDLYPERSVLEILDIQTGYKCDECEAVHDETAGAKLYECGECGSVFNANNGGGPYGSRCEACGKFASKRADDSCALCEEGEVEAVTYVECPYCEEGVELDDLVEHLSGTGCK